MAERLRVPEKLEEPPPVQWAHDWHPYTDYLNVHHSHMTALLKTGAVLRDRLSFVETADGRELVQVRVFGRIECRDGVVIYVDKYLDVRRGRQRRYEIRGARYSYQAWFRDPEQTIIRYDTAHGGLKGIHCHRRNPSSGRLVRQAITLEQLPTLSDFIEEVLGIADKLR